MSDEQNQAPPPPPPSAPPPPDPVAPPPPAAGGGGGQSENRGLMIFLSYLWILALVPLLVEKNDTEVQWHAKNGLVLFAAEVVVWILLSILSMIPVIQLAGCVLVPGFMLLALVVRIFAIVKGVKGERLVVPGISHYADQF